ncbi:MAG: hypothetical protein WDO73_21780 [Ignavibacteriota bacterium]
MGIKNVTIQGTEPMAVTEAFNFTAENCSFISDFNITGANTHGLNMNTMRDFRFSNNQFSSIGATVVGIELPQRNSQTGVFEGNQFTVRSVVFGEYGAHFNLTGNNFTLTPDSSDHSMIALGGLDVTFANNTVNGSGSIPVISIMWGLTTMPITSARFPSLAIRSIARHGAATVCSWRP